MTAGQPLGPLIHSFFIDHLVTVKGLRPASVRSYRDTIRLLLGFVATEWIDPSRDYFDQFLLYVTFSALVLYLGVAGWRHAETTFPSAETAPSPNERAKRSRAR